MIRVLQTIKKQTIGFYFILQSAVGGIIGFIAVYLFKPIWEKIINSITNFFRKK